MVNTVPFESYLRGVVPDESIPSWPAAALEAQAIAARSYALTGMQKDEFYDLYSDTRSQVYNGIESEEASTDAAIAKTANLVARIGSPSGDVARTYFFSTSAGRTAANEQVWCCTPYSYLRSVASPYESASPYFFWRGKEIKRYTPAGLASALRASGTLRNVTTTTYPSGYADDVVVRTSSGSQTLAAGTVQSRLELRSTYFRIQLVSISAPNTVAPGAFVTLRGRAPLTGSTSVLLRRDGARAVPVKLKPTGALGSWVVRTRMPASSLTAQLTRDGIPGPRIAVNAASLATMSRR
jgi:SpoIID/LytB domain protein